MMSPRSLSLRVMVLSWLPSSSEKAPNASNRLFHVLVGGLRAHWQRDHLATDRFSLRQMVLAELQSAMVPHRLRPTDESFDSVLLQKSPQFIPSRSSDHVILIGILVFGACKMWE